MVVSQGHLPNDTYHIKANFGSQSMTYVAEENPDPKNLKWQPNFCFPVNYKDVDHIVIELWNPNEKVLQSEYSAKTLFSELNKLPGKRQAFKKTFRPKSTEFSPDFLGSPRFGLNFESPRIRTPMNGSPRSVETSPRGPRERLPTPPREERPTRSVAPAGSSSDPETPKKSRISPAASLTSSGEPGEGRKPGERLVLSSPPPTLNRERAHTPPGMGRERGPPANQRSGRLAVPGRDASGKRSASPSPAAGLLTFSCDWSLQQWDPGYKIVPGTGDEEISVELFFTSAKWAVERQINDFKGCTCRDIPAPSVPAGEDCEMVLVFGEHTTPDVKDFSVLDTDPDSPVPSKVLIGGYLMNMLLPFKDQNTFCSDRVRAIKYIKEVVANLHEPVEGHWQRKDGCEVGDSDELMTRFFFYNNGTEFIQVSKEHDGFIADLEWMRQFDVRDQYDNYGGKIYFDKTSKLQKIWIEGKEYFPGDKDWAWAKLFIRSSAFVACAGLHLMTGHLQWGNFPNYAQRKFLSPNHPIRRLMHSHYWRSAMVARKSLLSLVPEDGLLHRGASFTLKGLHELYKHLIHKYEYKLWPQELKERGMDDYPELFPPAKDGLMFHKMVCDYVYAFIDNAYPTDEDVENDDELQNYWDVLVDYLQFPEELTKENLKVAQAEILFRVTGWHQHLGNAVALMEDPARVSLRLVKNKLKEYLFAPAESLFIQGLVTELTTMPMPKMLDYFEGWSHMFNTQEEKDIYRKFVDSMKDLSGQIVKFNKQTNGDGLPVRYPFKDFDPAVVCVSISS